MSQWYFNTKERKGSHSLRSMSHLPCCAKPALETRDLALPVAHLRGRLPASCSCRAIYLQPTAARIYAHDLPTPSVPPPIEQSYPGRGLCMHVWTELTADLEYKISHDFFCVCRKQNSHPSLLILALQKFVPFGSSISTGEAHILRTDGSRLMWSCHIIASRLNKRWSQSFSFNLF